MKQETVDLRVRLRVPADKLGADLHDLLGFGWRYPEKVADYSIELAAKTSTPASDIEDLRVRARRLINALPRCGWCTVQPATVKDPCDTAPRCDYCHCSGAVDMPHAKALRALEAVLGTWDDEGRPMPDEGGGVVHVYMGRPFTVRPRLP